MLFLIANTYMKGGAISRDPVRPIRPLKIRSFKIGVKRERAMEGNLDISYI